jgi:hypothetical protein
MAGPPHAVFALVCALLLLGHSQLSLQKEKHMLGAFAAPVQGAAVCVVAGLTQSLGQGRGQESTLRHGAGRRAAAQRRRSALHHGGARAAGPAVRRQRTAVQRRRCFDAVLLKVGQGLGQLQLQQPGHRRIDKSAGGLARHMKEPLGRICARRRE